MVFQEHDHQAVVEHDALGLRDLEVVEGRVAELVHPGGLGGGGGGRRKDEKDVKDNKDRG